MYAVHHPERATLAVRRKTVFDEWAMHELRAPRNAEPAPTTIAYDVLSGSVEARDAAKAGLLRYNYVDTLAMCIIFYYWIFRLDEQRGEAAAEEAQSCQSCITAA